MKIGELLKNLLTKIGVDVNAKATADKTFAELLALQSELPDELATELETKLLTLDAAKNNNELKNKIKSEVLNALDAQHNELMDEYEFDDAVKSEFKNNKNSYDRNKAITKKIADLKAAKAAATGTGDKAAYQKQIDDLNASIKTDKANYEKSIADLKANHDEQLTGITLTGMLTGRNYAFPKEMNQQAQVDAVNAVLQRELAAKGAKIINAGNGQLRLVKSDTNDDYHDDKHNKIDLSKFIDGALAQNNLLAVSNPPPPGGGVAPKIIPPGGRQINDRGFGSALDSAIAEAAQHS